MMVIPQVQEIEVTDSDVATAGGDKSLAVNTKIEEFLRKLPNGHVGERFIPRLEVVGKNRFILYYYKAR